MGLLQPAGTVLPVELRVGDVIECRVGEKATTFRVSGFEADRPLLRPHVWGRDGIETAMNERHVAALAAVYRDNWLVYSADQGTA
jgi:hypothetical protein